MIKDKYYTTHEAGQVLGVTSDHVRRLILEGKLKAEKKGWSWLIWHKDLAQIQRKRLNKPKDKEL